MKIRYNDNVLPGDFIINNISGMTGKVINVHYDKGVRKAKVRTPQGKKNWRLSNVERYSSEAQERFNK